MASIALSAFADISNKNKSSVNHLLSGFQSTNLREIASTTKKSMGIVENISRFFENIFVFFVSISPIVELSAHLQPRDMIQLPQQSDDVH